MTTSTIVWNFAPALPMGNRSVLIAIRGRKMPLLGYYDARAGCWWQSPRDVDLFINKPVRAWAYAPVNP